MGSSQSKDITKEQLEDYLILTYLTQAEIFSLIQRFKTTYDSSLQTNLLNVRVPVEHIYQQFPQIQCNPFKDRIAYVFSSEKNGMFSFEDVLDFCSVMSERCSDNVKASWAFKIFDIDGNNSIDEGDIKGTIDSLTGKDQLSDEQKQHIVDILLAAMGLENKSSIGPLEFEHAVSKMPGFAGSFTISL